MIRVTLVRTTDGTNVLSGTELASIPSPGALKVLAASTQNDTTITLFTPGERVEQFQRPLPIRTNGMPSESDDEPIIIPVAPGDQPRLDVDVVTGATVILIISFFSAEELGESV